MGSDPGPTGNESTIRSAIRQGEVVKELEIRDFTENILETLDGDVGEPYRGSPETDGA